MADLLGIVGSVTSPPSKTRVAVERALDAAAEEFDVTTRTLHLAEYDIDTADGRTLEEYGGDTATILDAIVRSDAYVIGTPVYRATYSGALKNVLDMVPRGTWQADAAPFENSTIGLVATAANEYHYLSIDNGLRPLMGFFGSYPSGSVYVHADQFGDDDGTPVVTDSDVAARLETLGKATIDLARAVDDSDHLSSLGPQI